VLAASPDRLAQAVSAPVSKMAQRWSRVVRPAESERPITHEYALDRPSLPRRRGRLRHGRRCPNSRTLHDAHGARSLSGPSAESLEVAALGARSTILCSTPLRISQSARQSQRAISSRDRRLERRRHGESGRLFRASTPRWEKSPLTLTAVRSLLFPRAVSCTIWGRELARKRLVFSRGRRRKTWNRHTPTVRGCSRTRRRHRNKCG
jgi:hypothetical protein